MSASIADAGAYWDLRAPAELQMPIVAFGDDGSAFFQDRWHRFAWMRDSGTRRMPVCIVDGIEIAHSRFGGRRTP